MHGQPKQRHQYPTREIEPVYDYHYSPYVRQVVPLSVLTLHVPALKVTRARVMEVFHLRDPGELS